MSVEIFNGVLIVVLSASIVGQVVINKDLSTISRELKVRIDYIEKSMEKAGIL